VEAEWQRKREGESEKDSARVYGTEREGTSERKDSSGGLLS